MKTFLWTSCFWIVVMIGGIICLWFNNWVSIPEVNEYVARFLNEDTKNLVVEDTMSCPSEESIIESYKKTIEFMDDIDENCQSMIPSCDCPMYNPLEKETVAKIETPVQNTPSYNEEAIINAIHGEMNGLAQNMQTYLQQWNEKQDAMSSQIQALSQQISSIKVSCESPEVAQKKNEILEQMKKLQEQYDTL